MLMLVFYFLVAILLSFLCSILEAVLLSLTPSYVSSKKESGAKSALLMESMKRNVDRPLAAILSLNTIAHTIGAAGVGAQAQVVFQHIPFSVISGVLTLLILVFSEILPKTIGAVYWRSLAVPSIYLVRFLVIILWPLVVLSQMFSRMLTSGDMGSGISRDEIHAMADIGQQEGVIDPGDAQMVQSVMRFQSIKVYDIFTPRPVVKYLSNDMTVKAVIESYGVLNYSRYPVLENDEEIVGYALRNDILLAAAKDEWSRTIQDLSHEAIIVSEQMPLKRVFGLFLRDREHMAVVVDEFGSFSGVLTMEDVIETLIGHEIMDEGDTVEDLREFARNSCKNIPEGEAEGPSGSKVREPDDSKPA